MSILNSTQRTLALTSIRSLTSVDASGAFVASPAGRASLLTELMGHGGLYTLLDTSTMTARVSAMVAAEDGESAQQAGEVESLVAVMQGKITSYFSHLNTDPYPIPSSLMSHIGFPHEGRTYTEKDTPETDSDLPAVFTFLGQFIDHDLTMNAVNLFDTQTGSVVEDASPFIDLDNVYGPRVNGSILPQGATDTGSLFDHLGRFKLDRRTDESGRTVIDLQRVAAGDNKGKALIADKRDDENQLVLQIHLLFVRLHNILVSPPFNLPFLRAYQQVVFAAQAIILNDYLPRILDDTTEDSITSLQRMTAATKAIRKAADGGDWESVEVIQALDYLKYRPFYVPKSRALSLTMPHEFAIGFRFGHSQFRDFYTLRPEGSPIPSFDNSLAPDAAGQVEDLRGSRPLTFEHSVDWPFFIENVHSKMIDTKVAKVAFDLPESAIPDDIKTISNLVQRNLIRSRQVGVCSGESLAKFYGVAALSPAEVEPEPGAKPDLYTQVLSKPLGGTSTFQTPLWYYILKEAELKGKGVRLGPLGSRVIGEVILAAIYYNPPKKDGESRLDLVVDQAWRAPPGAHPGDDLTTMKGLVTFVTHHDSAPTDDPSGPAPTLPSGDSSMSDIDVLMHNVWGVSNCAAPDKIIEQKPTETLKVIVQGSILTITLLNPDETYSARIYGRRLVRTSEVDTFVILPSIDSGNDDPLIFRANGSAVVYRESGKLRLRAVGSDYTQGSCNGWVFDATETAET